MLQVKSIVQVSFLAQLEVVTCASIDLQPMRQDVSRRRFCRRDQFHTQQTAERKDSAKLHAHSPGRNVKVRLSNITNCQSKARGVPQFLFPTSLRHEQKQQNPRGDLAARSIYIIFKN